MDVIKLHPTTYNNAAIVNNIEKKLWVERYREPGEFSFTGKASSGLRETLPLGSLVSHIGTECVMMVETHEIDEAEDDENPDVVITGRSLDFFFDYRAAARTNEGTTHIATGGVSPTPEAASYYGYDDSDYTWEQLVLLLQEQLMATVSTWSTIIDIPNILIRHDISATETKIEKDVKIGQLSKAVATFVDYADLGIRIERPNGSHATLDFIVTKGFDVSGTTQFDWEKGDLKKAKYLWTNKNYYNGIRVRGKYYSYTIYPSGKTGFDVRMRMIDEEKIDDSPEFMSGAQLAVLDNRLKAYGQAELNRQRSRTMTDAVISPTNRFVYRSHYNIGDLVYVKGNYGLESVMRVTEFAEIEDENGDSGYPTVSAV